MKIIAEISRDTLMVEMTREEIAKCVGYAYESALPANLRPLQVGAELNVNESYSDIRTLIGSSQEISTCVASLKKLISVVEKTAHKIGPAVEAVKSKMPKN